MASMLGSKYFHCTQIPRIEMLSNQKISARFLCILKIDFMATHYRLVPKLSQNHYRSETNRGHEKSNVGNTLFLKNKEVGQVSQ
jgi:hypothetical protein